MTTPLDEAVGRLTKLSANYELLAKELDVGGADEARVYRQRASDLSVLLSALPPAGGGDFGSRAVPCQGHPPEQGLAAGWLYFNPDNGTEWSADHPIKSGECPDAEDVREATAGALVAEMLDSWNQLEQERAYIRSLQARIGELDQPPTSQDVRGTARELKNPAPSEPGREAVDRVDVIRTLIDSGSFGVDAEDQEHLEELAGNTADAVLALFQGGRDG